MCTDCSLKLLTCVCLRGLEAEARKYYWPLSYPCQYFHPKSRQTTNWNKQVIIVKIKTKQHKTYHLLTVLISTKTTHLRHKLLIWRAQLCKFVKCYRCKSSPHVDQQLFHDHKCYSSGGQIQCVLKMGSLRYFAWTIMSGQGGEVVLHSATKNMIHVCTFFDSDILKLENNSLDGYSALF